MKILELLQDYNIDYATEGHRHCQPGWVNVVCPFCTGNPGYHLGHNTDNNYFHCWRCGAKYTDTVIMNVLNVSKAEANTIIKEYEGTTVIRTHPKPQLKTYKIKPPTNTGELQAGHKRYLIRRGYCPEVVRNVWNVQGTGFHSRLDAIDYSRRIFIPVYWNNKMVSFQTRDITDKHVLKYLTCSKRREVMHHKHVLYGKQDAWTDTGICVEGVFDVWRFGVNSFCTFGTSYTTHQVREIVRNFKRVFVVFDNEKQAQRKAQQLTDELIFRGVDCSVVTLVEGDPGNMSQKVADEFVKNLLNN